MTRILGSCDVSVGRESGTVLQIPLSWRLSNADGSGSFAEVNAMQRIWRDSNIAARHAVILPQVSLETYGKALLGIQEHIAPII